MNVDELIGDSINLNRIRCGSTGIVPDTRCMCRNNDLVATHDCVVCTYAVSCKPSLLVQTVCPCNSTARIGWLNSAVLGVASTGLLDSSSQSKRQTFWQHRPQTAWMRRDTQASWTTSHGNTGQMELDSLHNVAWNCATTFDTHLHRGNVAGNCQPTRFNFINIMSDFGFIQNVKLITNHSAIVVTGFQLIHYHLPHTRIAARWTVLIVASARVRHLVV